MPRLGQHISEDHKARISLANRGRKPCLGRKHSDETKQKIRLANIGSNNHRWTGGKSSDKDGYILIKAIDHPNRMTHGYVFEHRLVMEKHLGRYLTPQEVVHHKNHDNTDNRIENLELFESHSKHMLHHTHETN